MAENRPDAPIAEKTASGEVIGAGIIAGLIAGIILGGFAMAYASIVGAGVWTPMQEIAATFYGPIALLKTSAAFWGVIIHLVVSALWGILFATIIPRRISPWEAYLGGLLFGIGVWIAMTFLVLPTVDPTMRARVALMPGTWFLLHLAFGAFVSVAALLRRALAHVPIWPS